MAKRSIRGWDTEVPELEAFLADYLAICVEHGMEFVLDYYVYDGGGYLTVGPSSGEEPYLNLEGIGDELPFVRRAMTEREQHYKVVAQIAAEKKRQVNEVVAEIQRYGAHIVGTDHAENNARVIVVRRPDMDITTPRYAAVSLSGLEMLVASPSGLKDLIEARVRMAMDQIGLKRG